MLIVELFTVSVFTLMILLAGEDAFLAAIVSEVHTGAVQFKLAPTYTLYMSARYRLSKLYRPDISSPERDHRLASFLNKIASMVHHTIQVMFVHALSECHLWEILKKPGIVGDLDYNAHLFV